MGKRRFSLERRGRGESNQGEGESERGEDRQEDHSGDGYASVGEEEKETRERGGEEPLRLQRLQVPSQRTTRTRDVVCVRV